VFAAALITAVIGEAISILFAATIYDQHHSRFTGLSANPFAFGEVDIPYPEHRLRILGPVVAWAIGLRGKAGAYVPIAFNIPLLMLFYVVLRHRTTRPLAVVFTLLMATTHVTMESRTLIGYHDTMVFFFVALAMISRSSFACALAFFLALLGDPRAAVTIPMLAIWTFTQSESKRPLADALVRFVILAAVVIVFLGISSVALDYLEYKSIAQAATGRYFTNVYVQQIRPGWLHLAAFMSFKAGWLLAIVPLWFLLGRRPFTTMILAGNLLVITALGLLVFDFARALTFCFPLLLIGAIELDRSARSLTVPIVGTCYLINLITPFYQGLTIGVWTISYPLPVELARWLLGK
jgi:hypothetical protein